MRRWPAGRWASLRGSSRLGAGLRDRVQREEDTHYFGPNPDAVEKRAYWRGERWENGRVTLVLGHRSHELIMD